MTKEEELGLAIKLAVEEHHGQSSKDKLPYILHPLHLMFQLMYDLQLATIAVLHDVIEDSNGRITLKVLVGMGFSSRVVSAVTLLTHDPKDDYLEVYIPWICSNYDAIRVKRKDLEHNGLLTRMRNKKELSSKDLERIEKYFKAFIILGEARDIFKRK